MQGYRQEYESPRLNSRGIRAESSEASLHPPTPKATEGQAILRLLLRQGYARPSEVLTKEGRTRRLRKGLLSHSSTASCPSIILVTEERPWSSAKEDKLCACFTLPHWVVGCKLTLIYTNLHSRIGSWVANSRSMREC